MSQDQPPKPNPDPLDDDLDDVWGSPTTHATPPPLPTPTPPSRSSRSGSPQPEVKGDRLNPPLNQTRSIWNQLLYQVRPALETALAKSRPLFQKLQTWWGATLPKIRRVLPKTLNQRLTDRMLTGVAITVAFVVLWVGTGALSGKPTPVSRTSPPQSTLTVKTAPNLNPLEAMRSSSPDGVITPSVPIASQTPLHLDLTPEQSLIAAIQDQVAEVTNQYANGLIQSIQANFRSSRLIVIVSNEWYRLSANRQDQLTTEMQKRALELNFNTLEMIDSQETLLARSPVIGETMVILKRQQEG